MSFFQENRREYEKRVAAIVEQSWMTTFPDEADTSSGKSKQGNDNSGGATTSAASANAGSRPGNLNNDASENSENHNS